MAHLAQGDGRINDIVWLRIDPRIINEPGVRITTEVSNKRGVVPLELNDALSIMDLEIIYTRTDWNDPAIRQRLSVADKYEILVPEVVPLAYVENPNG